MWCCRILKGFKTGFHPHYKNIRPNFQPQCTSREQHLFWYLMKFAITITISKLQEISRLLEALKNQLKLIMKGNNLKAEFHSWKNLSVGIHMKMIVGIKTKLLTDWTSCEIYYFAMWEVEKWALSRTKQSCMLCQHHRTTHGMKF